MAKLPAGTVTFCFTDIEGSTQAFARLGPRFLDLLEDHRRIIRAAVAEHGGAEVKTEGDGFFLAFADPVSAVAACVGFQRALTAHHWPDGGEVKVRCGLHIGVAAPLEDDYMTYEVHQAARIGAAGHGGQTLLSTGVAALVANALPPDVTLRDLGSHELKDLEPMHLHQVCHPELENSFPPLRTIRGTRGYVPTPPSTLVGRADDVEALLAQLAGSRLVTITGSGGVGKTRLAVEVARERLGAVRDGVWFIDLAPVTDGSRVEETVLDALGVVREGSIEPRHQLLSHLGTRQALLVIDNCEHLIDAASATVAAILAACPDTKILATSREALGVGGEQAWRLRSLATDNGIELFRQRACLVQPTFDLDADRASVERVVERLDGIPLAIELAAARIRVLTPSQIAERLDDRFRLLTGGSRTALARQRTLEATVDWSYGLLDDDERDLFRCLSVFIGGFDLDAAEDVWGRSVLDTLERLVDKSMVIASLHKDTLRYRLLETIRHYGWTKLLDEGEGVRARDRHYEHYAALVEEIADGLLDRRENETAAKLQIEYDNIRGAIEWALADETIDRALRIVARLGFFWAIAGRTEEGLELLVPALDRTTGAEDREALVEAHVGAAHLQWVGSRSNEGVRSHARSAMELAAERPSPRRTWYDAWAVFLASVTGQAEEHDPDILERAIERGREAGPEASIPLAHAMLTKGGVLRESMRFDDASALLDEAIEVAKSCGSISTLAELLERKALLMVDIGEIDEACRLAAEAVAASEHGPNVYFRMFALFALNLAKTIRGDPDAIASAHEIVSIASASGLRYQEGRATFEIGWHELELGDIDGAYSSFERALTLATELGFDRPSIAFLAATAFEGLAACRLRTGRFDEARRMMQRNLELAIEFGLQWVIALTHNSLGWLEQEAGELDDASSQHLAALAVLSDVRTRVHAMPATQGRAAAIRGLAGVAYRRTELERAARLFGSASRVREPNSAAPRTGTLLGAELVERLRADLGPQAFDEAWSEGVALGLDGAIELVAPSPR